MNYDNDYALCECDLAALQDFVTGLEQRHQISVVREPSICLT
ncbi:MAG: hypothetical protein WDO73_34425 [Ignavibacteriota bacterium]